MQQAAEELFCVKLRMQGYSKVTPLYFMNTKQNHGGAQARFACTLRDYSDIVIDLDGLCTF